MIKVFCDICQREQSRDAHTIRWTNHEYPTNPYIMNDNLHRKGLPEFTIKSFGQVCQPCNEKIIKAIQRLAANAGQEYQ